MDIEEAIKYREGLIARLQESKEMVDTELERNEYILENLKRLRILTERGLEYDA